MFFPPWKIPKLLMMGAFFIALNIVLGDALYKFLKMHINQENRCLGL